MAFCMDCGQVLSEEAKFCANCGKAVNSDSTAQRKTVYDGELHKCPNCGELLNSFAANCPLCGYELRNLKTETPVNELVKQLKVATTIAEKNELITNFYVPNTKKDICDFFILAVSNLEDTSYDTDDAWRAKLEQTYHKARLSFGNTPDFEYIDKLYGRTRAKVSKRWFSSFTRKNKIACATVLLIAAGVLLIGLAIALFVLFEDSFGGTWGGALFAVIGINVLFAPVWAFDEMKKEEKKKQKLGKTNARAQTVDKDADEFVDEDCEDVIAQLIDLGFNNIVAKAVKMGVFDTEGTIKNISIAGDSEFSGDEEFDIDSKVVIQYYSRDVKE